MIITLIEKQHTHKKNAQRETFNSASAAACLTLSCTHNFHVLEPCILVVRRQSWTLQTRKFFIFIVSVRVDVWIFSEQKMRGVRAWTISSGALVKNSFPTFGSEQSCEWDVYKLCGCLAHLLDGLTTRPDGVACGTFNEIKLMATYAKCNTRKLTVNKFEVRPECNHHSPFMRLEIN